MAVGRWWSETCSCYFFELLIFYYFRYFQPKGTFEFFLLLFQIILNQKELFFKKGTNGKVWYIADDSLQRLYQMVCEMAIEDVLTCVDFIAKAAGVGLLLPYTVQPFISGE